MATVQVLAGHVVRPGTLTAVVKPAAYNALAFKEIDFVAAVPEGGASRKKSLSIVPLRVTLLLGPAVVVST
jgi:hypothetical protein